jgi:hypothetical protein
MAHLDTRVAPAPADGGSSLLAGQTEIQTPAPKSACPQDKGSRSASWPPTATPKAPVRRTKARPVYRDVTLERCQRSLCKRRRPPLPSAGEVDGVETPAGGGRGGLFIGLEAPIRAGEALRARREGLQSARSRPSLASSRHCAAVRIAPISSGRALFFQSEPPSQNEQAPAPMRRAWARRRKASAPGNKPWAPANKPCVSGSKPRQARDRAPRSPYGASPSAHKAREGQYWPWRRKKKPPASWERSLSSSSLKLVKL